MRSKIQQLSEITINQIAAGEVVEDPASVLKELIENSIDAGASEIAVVVKGGGLSYLSVEDDGCGMLSDDVDAAIMRHATSKISSIEDLHNAMTYGFRGEALSSIAAVGEISISTRAEDAVVGVKAMFENGVRVLKDGYHGSVGTVIEVCKLFNNIPARKKFLANEKSLNRKLFAVVSDFVLSNVAISFSFMSDFGTSLSASVLAGEFRERLLDRIRLVIGERVSEDWRFIRHETHNIKVEGYISGIGNSYKNRAKQWMFVNGRCVNPGIWGSVIKSAYDFALESGGHVGFVLFICIPPEDVDVNVHPRKLEVRFRKEKMVRIAVVSAVRKAIFENMHTVSNTEAMRPTCISVNAISEIVGKRITNKSQYDIDRIERKEQGNFFCASPMPTSDDMNNTEPLHGVSVDYEQRAKSFDFGDPVSILQMVGNRYCLYRPVGSDKVFIADVLRVVCSGFAVPGGDSTYMFNVTEQMLLIPIELSLSQQEIIWALALKDLWKDVGISIGRNSRGAIVVSGITPWLDPESVVEVISAMYERFPNVPCCDIEKAAWRAAFCDKCIRIGTAVFGKEEAEYFVSKYIQNMPIRHRCAGCILEFDISTAQKLFSEQ